MAPQAEATTQNPIVLAFHGRERKENIYALRQWIGFLGRWDGTIVDASNEQIAEAMVVLTRMLDECEANVPAHEQVNAAERGRSLRSE